MSRLNTRERAQLVELARRVYNRTEIRADGGVASPISSKAAHKLIAKGLITKKPCEFREHETEDGDQSFTIKVEFFGLTGRGDRAVRHWRQMTDRAVEMMWALADLSDLKA